MFIIRWLVGCIILGLNFIFTPRSPKRESSVQQEIDESTQYFTLYQLPACPFCVKVRRAIKREGLHIKIVSTKEDVYRNELVNGGGRHKVPCMRDPVAGEHLCPGTAHPHQVYSFCTCILGRLDQGRIIY